MIDIYDDLVKWFSEKYTYFSEEPQVEYDEFVRSKVVVATDNGFEADLDLIHPSTFPHQRDIIVWACKRGSALVAAAFGLGKTHIQIELSKQVINISPDGSKFLVVAPLGVKHVFADVDGPRLGTEWEYVKSDEDVRNSKTPYLITNYERVREGNINPLLHNIVGVSLDEGSTLRSLGSKTYNVFEHVFANVPYKFVCTATPDPNEHRELIYYSRWLGILDTSFALTQWFKRDTSKAGNLQLIPQHAQSFWLWVASWAIFLYKPSDLGYSNEGYELPPMNIVWHRLPVDHTRAFQFKDSKDQYRLLLNPSGSASETAHEKRATIPEKLEKLVELVGDMPDKHIVIWHELEDERKEIEKVIPEATSVFGSQKLETKEEKILGFERGEFRILVTKPKIAGSGCNFQKYCHTAIYFGVDYKFEGFFQSLHRMHRFGQGNAVTIHIVYSASEDIVISALKAKWARYDEQMEKMRGIVQEYGLSSGTIKRNLRRTTGVKTVNRKKGRLFELMCNDCTLETRGMKDDSVGMIFTSYPFGNHYSYTTSNNDFGHNLNDEDFFRQMDYLLPELYRVLDPGRILLAHVKDRILYSHMTTGFTEVSPFTAWNILAHMKHGFIYAGEIVVVTDVVRENNSTYRLGYTEMCKDGTKVGCGLPEKLQIFRKPPSSTDKQYADNPVVHEKERYTIGNWQLDASSHWTSNGNVLVSPELYDYEAHVARLDHLENAGNLPKTFLCEPPPTNTEGVWTEINFMQGLNNQQSLRGIENHLCPLPFDIVKRGLERFSMPGDLVYDPFAGLGTVGYVALQMNRRFIGCELSEKYFEWAGGYLESIEYQVTAPTLFSYVLDKTGVDLLGDKNGDKAKAQVTQVDL